MNSEIFLIVLLVISIVLFSSLSRTDEKNLKEDFKEKFRKIKSGMSERSVEIILGTPFQIMEISEKKEIFVKIFIPNIRMGTIKIIIFFQDGKVIKKESEELF